VVLVVVDQLRPDYLERFRHQFTGGLKTLVESGAVFSAAHYEQWPTVTAVGHATIATGATPATHGIVGNSWYDRGSKADVGVVVDPEAAMVPSGAKPGASPHRLIGSTLADELRLATNGRGKVVSVALKDRSAILLGGRRPTGAFWYDEATGTFETSTYYAPALPSWVKSFNDRKPADAYFGSPWDRTLPESEYAGSDSDDSEGESAPFGDRTLPHIPGAGLKAPGATFYGQLLGTPFANDLLLDLARSAVDAEALGSDELPDILAVGLSANDIVGHYFGPYSREVHDMALKTDRSLGAFFSFLDDRLGRDAYVVVLTSDHGVAPVPTAARGVAGAYVRLDSVAEPIERALTARFGGNAPWVASTSGGTSGGVYLDEAVATAAKADFGEVQREAARAAASISGVRFALAGADIASGRYNHADVLQRRVAAGYCPGRSPDVVVVFDPFAVVMGGPTGTTHGTPYSYDTHVPLIFYGAGIAPGYRAENASVEDLASTVSLLLGLTPPSGCSGRALLGADPAPRGATRQTGGQPAPQL
jgi:predicted AlkP superfamily pyrophosphatase or phosphodiesterase